MFIQHVNLDLHTISESTFIHKSLPSLCYAHECVVKISCIYILVFLYLKQVNRLKKIVRTELISSHLAHFHYLTAPETVYVYTQQVPSLKCNTGPPSVFLRAGRTAQTLVPYPRSSNCSTLFLMVGVILNAAE